MRLTLANRISILVIGVIGLAVISSLAAVLSSWHFGRLMERTVGENLPSVRAAEELEIAVLEQRGLVASYLLDHGNQKWISDLRKRETNFAQWIRKAHDTVQTDHERNLLARLEKVYLQYDMAREEVVSLYDAGQVEAATKLLLDDVVHDAEKAYDLCEQFIAANEQFVDSKVTDARRQIRWVSLGVGSCVLLTIGLGAALLWLFFYGVLVPVRAMVADARDFSGESPMEGQSLPTDELRTVGVYLRHLMTNVADTQTTLERSRRELRDAEKLATVGKLAASVAHEIRNPLTAIKMWLFSIQKEVGGMAGLDRKFEIVSEEIKRLESIVRRFLEFSRPPELKLALESVSKMLDRTLELIGPQIADAQIRLERKDAANLPRVLADREQFRQVLMNLLNNAAEAIGEAGQIRVVTTEEYDPEGHRWWLLESQTAGREFLRKSADGSSSPSSARRTKGQDWGCASQLESWRNIRVGSCSRPRTNREQPSPFTFPQPQRMKHEQDSRSRRRTQRAIRLPGPSR